MATAADIDRIVHHSVILEFDVPSYRTSAAAESSDREGIRPVRIVDAPDKMVDVVHKAYSCDLQTGGSIRTRSRQPRLSTFQYNTDRDKVEVLSLARTRYSETNHTHLTSFSVSARA